MRSAAILPVSRNRSHTIAVESAGPGKKHLLNSIQERFARCALLLFRAADDKIIPSIREYVATLMCSHEHYNNILWKLYVAETEFFWTAFYQNISPELRRLQQLRETLQEPPKHPLDHEYLLRECYLPLRGQLEKDFRRELTRFSDLYAINARADDRAEFCLIWEETGKTPSSGPALAKLVRKIIFRNLLEKFSEQVAVLQPFASRFSAGKSRLATMKRILRGLSDFDYFQYQYGPEGGGRTYISTFTGSVESALRIVYKRNGSSVVRGGAIRDRQVQLTHNLWKLYVAGVSAEKIVEKFSSLRPPPLAKPLKTELDFYLDFASKSLTELEESLQEDFVISGKEDELCGYIELAGSYLRICQDIAEAIGVIVPLLNYLLEGGTGKDKRFTLSQDMLQAMLGVMREIYERLSVILVNIKSQVSALTQILA